MSTDPYAILGEVVAIIQLDDVEHRMSLGVRVRDALQAVGCDKQDIETFKESARSMILKLVKKT